MTRLRTYRLLPALLALSVVLTAAAPLVRASCGMSTMEMAAMPCCEDGHRDGHHGTHAAPVPHATDEAPPCHDAPAPPPEAPCPAPVAQDACCASGERGTTPVTKEVDT